MFFKNLIVIKLLSLEIAVIFKLPTLKTSLL